MSSGRIGKYQAEDIAKSAASDAVAEENRLLDIEENRLVEQTVAYLLKKHDLLEQWIKVRTSPKVFLDVVTQLNPRINGYAVTISINSAHKPVPIVPRIITLKDQVIEHGHPLATAITSFQNRTSSVREREKALRTRVLALVGRATTFGGLAKLWPEGEPYWGAMLEASKTPKNLPAINIEETNALLGLPRGQDSRKAKLSVA